MINPRQRLGPISFRNKALQDILKSSKETIGVLGVENVDNNNSDTLNVYVSDKGQWLDPALSIEPNCIYNYTVPTLDTDLHLP